MKSIPEIHSIMVDTLDVDDMEASKIRLQHILTQEELQSMRDFNEGYAKQVRDLYRKHSLGLIDEGQLVKAEHDLMEKKFHELQGDD